MKQIRVLVADHDATIRRALRLLLVEAGDIVIAAEASMGQETVELSARLQPDVVVVDCGLPDLDCSSVTRSIRSGPGAVSVVLYDTYGGQSKSALEAGASAHIAKGSNPEELLDAIRAAAGSAKQEALAGRKNDPQIRK